MSRRSFLAGVARRRLSVWSRWKVRRVLMPGAHPQFSTISRTSYRMAAEERKPAPRTPGRVGWVAVSEHQQRNAPGMPWAEVIHPGTPVVTMVGTVGAELVSHGVSGLVLSDRVLLPGAISKAERLDPRRVRAHAASRFDLRGMVSAYEWLLTQFAAIPAADGGGGLAATPSDAPAGSAPVPTVRDS